MEMKELTERVIGACIEVHKYTGPGLLESAYQQCLCHELTLRDIRFQLQYPLSVNYKGTLLDCGYRIDLLIDGRLVVELKALDKILPIHEAQLLTHLKLSGLRLGLLINFNVPVIRNSIIRRVL